MKKILYTITGLLFMSALAIAGQYGQVPLVTGSQDPSQLNATINSVIIQRNAQAAGLLYVNATAVTTAGTSEETFYTYTLPGGYLSQNGQSVRVRCHAQTGANANNKTLTVYFGASTATTGVQANNANGAFIDYIATRTGAATQVMVSEIRGGTTAAATTSVLATATPTETLSGDIVIRCTATDATAGGVLGKMMTVESLR